MSNLLYVPKKASGLKIATGGIIKDYAIGGVKYRFHEFKTSGDFEIISGTFDDVEYLIIGGGATAVHISGGGAGGVLHNFISGPVNKPIGVYPFEVGLGVTYRNPSNNGGDSTAFGLTAFGGAPGDSVAVGGSTGGRYSGTVANPVEGQGHKGGSGTYKSSYEYAGGSGGGAGGPGQIAYHNYTHPYVGPVPGAAINLSEYVGTYYGVSGFFAAGGNGGLYWSGATGNTNYRRGQLSPHSSAPGSGGGLARDANNTGRDSSSARNGVVIIRYKISDEQFQEFN